MISIPGLIPLPSIKVGSLKEKIVETKSHEVSKLTFHDVQNQNKAFIEHIIKNSNVIESRLNILKDYLNYLDNIIQIEEKADENNNIYYDYSIPLSYSLSYDLRSAVPGVSFEYFDFAKEYVSHNVNFFVLNAIQYLKEKGITERFMEHIYIIHYQKDNSPNAIVRDLFAHSSGGYFITLNEDIDFETFKLSSTVYDIDKLKTISKNLTGLEEVDNLNKIAFLSKWNNYLEFIRKNSKPIESFKKNKDLFIFLYNIVDSICNVSIKLENLKDYIYEEDNLIMYSPGYSVSNENRNKFLSVAILASVDDIDYNKLEEKVLNFEKFVNSLDNLKVL
ncbi:MAG: hypothetical protein QXF12_00850 [Candidatus Aenigmatarchaeota archaeon]